MKKLTVLLPQMELLEKTVSIIKEKSYSDKISFEFSAFGEITSEEKNELENELSQIGACIHIQM